MSKKPKPPAKSKRGREPEILKIEGEWTDAIKRAMGRGKPPEKPRAIKHKKDT